MNGRFAGGSLLLLAVTSACGGLVAVPDGDGATRSEASTPPGSTGNPGGQDASLDATSPRPDAPVEESDATETDATDAAQGADVPLYPPVAVPTTWLTCDASACAPVVLAANLARPWGIAVDDSGVYTSNCGNGNSPGSITRIPLDGGTVTTLAANPTPIDTGQDCYGLSVGLRPPDLYWQSFGATGFVAAVPMAGGTPTVLAGGNVQIYEYGLVNDANNLYWANNTEVMREPLDGGPPVVLATSPAGWPVTGIAVDATGVYWADGESIMKSPIAGGPATQLAPGNAGSLAVDAQNVYWGEGSTGAVMSVPTGGGAPTVWVGTYGVANIAVDDARIYWTADESLWALPKSGGPLERLAPVPYPQAIALDDTFAYVTALLGSNPMNASDAVLRVPKW